MQRAARDVIRGFIVGRTPAKAFEEWLYAASEVEAELGPDLHLELISTDYGDASAVLSAREKLRLFAAAHFPEDCLCPLMDDSDGTGMGTDRDQQVRRTFEQLTEYGPQRPWLTLCRCRDCGQHWLVAQEAEMNDATYYRRASPEIAARILEAKQWPPIFETIGDVMAAGAPEADWSHFRTSPTRRPK